jgi:hypothetical protein
MKFRSAVLVPIGLLTALSLLAVPLKQVAVHLTVLAMKETKAT